MIEGLGSRVTPEQGEKAIELPLAKGLKKGLIKVEDPCPDDPASEESNGTQLYY